MSSIISKKGGVMRFITLLMCGGLIFLATSHAFEENPATTRINAVFVDCHSLSTWEPALQVKGTLQIRGLGGTPSASGILRVIAEGWGTFQARMNGYYYQGGNTRRLVLRGFDSEGVEDMEIDLNAPPQARAGFTRFTNGQISQMGCVTTINPVAAIE
jgi:hypothetical protein